METPLVLKAIAEQNAQFGDVSEMDMRVLDETYRSEVDQHHLQMVKLLLDKSVSQYLKTRQDASQGAIVEFFVTDSHGLNVGQSTITTDYWQGDEEKYLRTFANGSREIFIDRAERNESTQMLQPRRASSSWTKRTDRSASRPSPSPSRRSEECKFLAESACAFAAEMPSQDLLRDIFLPFQNFP
ncbi:hypothetical protein JOH51_003644 [Rhizobium leguminosarum]|nr:hypothetical protein [Rhizobium leguminosarum]